MRRITSLTYILIVTTMLSLPLLQMSFSFVSMKSIALDERRTPTNLDEPFHRWLKMDSKLANDINKWFDDRYGFRDFLVRANNELSYRLFHYSEKVYIGKEGWLYDKDAYQQVLLNASDAVMERNIINKIRDLKEHLAKSGIKLVVVLNPHKSTIYPEYMSSDMPKIKKMRLLDGLRKSLNSEQGLIFIDSTAILLSHKNNDVVYHKTDIHMNPKGSYYVYREMIKKIAIDSQISLPDYSLDGWRWKKGIIRNGSEQRYLAKFTHIGEVNEYVDIQSESYKNDNYGDWQFNVGKGTITKEVNFPIYDWIFKNKRNDRLILPPILIFGTSFSDGFFDLKMNEQFRVVYRTKGNIPNRILPLTSNMPPIKYFILEYPEMLLYLIPQIPIEHSSSA